MFAIDWLSSMMYLSRDEAVFARNRAESCLKIFLNVLQNVQYRSFSFIILVSVY